MHELRPAGSGRRGKGTFTFYFPFSFFHSVFFFKHVLFKFLYGRQRYCTNDYNKPE